MKIEAPINNISLKKNNELITQPDDIAEMFNNHFTNITKTLTQSNNINTVSSANEVPISSMYLQPTQHEEILKIISELKTKYSFGIDNIPDAIIKQYAHYIAMPLADVCNKSFEQAIFPNQLKIARVKPLFKKGEKTQINNYRPISLLSGFSKVIEKVFYRRLLSYIKQTDILSDTQYGFRKNKSTETALFTFVNNILKNLDNKRHIIGIFFLPFQGL